jgi:hypothetical protein
MMLVHPGESLDSPLDIDYGRVKYRTEGFTLAKSPVHKE